MATSVDKCFSEGDLKQITEAIKAAELKTSGEIAIMIAPHSRHWFVDRWLFSAALAIVFSVVSLYFTSESNWGTYYNFTQSAFWGIIGFLIGYFGINLWLKRLSARHKAVWKTALKHFAKLQPTRGHTGVLIFISVDENEAAIVADKAIAEKLDQNYWQLPHGMIEKAIQKGHHAEGIIEAIQEIATQLAQFFPREADDINELADGPEIVDL
jgi:putative membrane protein